MRCDITDKDLLAATGLPLPAYGPLNQTWHEHRDYAHFDDR